MSATALVTGTLFRAPEQRTSKAGKPFVVGNHPRQGRRPFDGLRAG
jgi:hypothetical protein